MCSYKIWWQAKANLPNYQITNLPSGHQTWWDGDLPFIASTNKVTQTFGHVVLQDHITN